MKNLEQKTIIQERGNCKLDMSDRKIKEIMDLQN